jgi:hypothetical protein
MTTRMRAVIAASIFEIESSAGADSESMAMRRDSSTALRSARDDTPIFELSDMF